MFSGDPQADNSIWNYVLSTQRPCFVNLRSLRVDEDSAWGRAWIDSVLAVLIQNIATFSPVLESLELTYVTFAYQWFRFAFLRELRSTLKVLAIRYATFYESPLDSPERVAVNEELAADLLHLLDFQELRSLALDSVDLPFTDDIFVQVIPALQNLQSLTLVPSFFSQLTEVSLLAMAHANKQLHYVHIYCCLPQHIDEEVTSHPDMSASAIHQLLSTRGAANTMCRSVHPRDVYMSVSGMSAAAFQALQEELASLLGPTHRYTYSLKLCDIYSFLNPG